MWKQLILIIIIIFIACNARADVALNGVTLNGATIIPTRAQLMCVGDSITEGSASSEGTGYRKNLYHLITANNYQWVGVYHHRKPSGLILEPPMPYYGYHSGMSGEETGTIEARLASDLDTAMPTPLNAGGVVLLHAGTNDINNSKVLADAVTNVIDMIDIIVAHDPNIAIYVALIIPIDSALDADVDTYNGLLNTALTTKQGSVSELYIVDMNTAFKDNASWATDYMSGALHPNDMGYSVMADTWATAILANE